MNARHWYRWFVGAEQAQERARARIAHEQEIERRAQDATAQQRASREQEVARLASLRCATCGLPLSGYTFENDFLCNPCGGFVNALSPEGDILSGYGRSGGEFVIGHQSDKAPISYAYHAWLTGHPLNTVADAVREGTWD